MRVAKTWLLSEKTWFLGMVSEVNNKGLINERALLGLYGGVASVVL